ncbi:efflux RND transporter periplasmic adaptor subunit [Catenovulum sp. SM1970]|uniref:efflux RND transporter periplasmic adaptor subunit n=1 Tax=Marinifaba aquimaris TaxID=2741323 RepID=UPI001574BB66|nr:efflux RND transporter periplasmic adaptor subunit [Marinifaba aquimaris]NTS77242.1 efflux RND transporter periplasmic adaptor subunit [Marinifaba aquimaris]
MSFKQFFAATLAVTCISLVACTPAPTPQVSQVHVAVHQVPEVMSQKVRHFPAVIQASQYTNLSFQLNGELSELIAREGLRVKKGDLLAKLDDTQLKLTVNEKKAKSDLLKVQASRAKQMVDKGNMAKSTYDELAAQYKMALADYAYAKIQLGYVELRAPFDGIIANVAIENYQAASVGQPVVSIHREDQVEITVDLPDSLVSSIDDKKVKPQREEINVRLDAYPDHIFKAKYKEHTAEQSDEDRSFTLVLQMPFDKAKPALQGMPGSVELDLAKIERDQAYYAVVPLEAVTLPDSMPIDSFKRLVWRVVDGKANAVEISMGRVVNISHVEVIGNIKAGDLVVTKGLQYLREGLPVEVVNNNNKDM